jgi:hypothetical protein
MERLRRPAHELRTAIELLPIETQEAMLEGMQSNDIIVGAYTDRRGGICPMLAAHRHGGRTDFAYFARAWDRYTKAKHPRPAHEREVRTLSAMLETSLAAHEARTTTFSRAISDHQAAARERRAAEARTTGFSWLQGVGRREEPPAESAEGEVAEPTEGELV